MFISLEKVVSGVINKWVGTADFSSVFYAGAPAPGTWRGEFL